MIYSDFMEAYQLLSANDQWTSQFNNMSTSNVSGNGPSGGPYGGPGPINSDIIRGSGLSDRNGDDLRDHDARNLRLSRSMLKGRQNLHLSGTPFSLKEGEDNVNKSSGVFKLASLSGRDSDIVGGRYIIKEGDRLYNIGETLDIGDGLWRSLDRSLKYDRRIADEKNQHEYDFARAMLDKFTYRKVISEDDIKLVSSFSQKNTDRINPILPSEKISRKLIDELLNV